MKKECYNLQITAVSLTFILLSWMIWIPKTFLWEGFTSISRWKYRHTQNLYRALADIAIVTDPKRYKVGENSCDFKAWGLFSILNWNVETIGILRASVSSARQVKCLTLSSIYWSAFRFKIQWKNRFSVVSMPISSHWPLSARIHGLQELLWVSEETVLMAELVLCFVSLIWNQTK